MKLCYKYKSHTNEINMKRKKPEKSHKQPGPKRSSSVTRNKNTPGGGGEA